MGFNGSGTYVRSYSWASEAAAGNPISSSKMDTEDNGFATGLSNCVTRDGQSPAQANIPMGGFKITGLGDATQPTDALNMETGDARYVLSGGTPTFTKLAIDTNYYLTLVSANPTIQFDTDASLAYDRTNAKAIVTIGGSAVASVSASTATLPATVNAGSNELGYRDLIINSQTAAYTLALTDRGKQISITSGGVTIPANAAVAFPVGSVVVVFNNSATPQTIAITTDTLRLAGTTTTGSRTISAYGVATLIKQGTTTWVVSGSGVS